MKNSIFTISILILLSACDTQLGGKVMNGTSSSSHASSSSSSSPMMPMTETDRELVEAYIQQNIDMLATTEPNVLGESFSVVMIEWNADNTAIVTYEDGINTVQANLEVQIENDTVVINEFTEISYE